MRWTPAADLPVAITLEEVLLASSRVLVDFADRLDSGGQSRTAAAVGSRAQGRKVAID